jgi:hypothetical protein
VDRLGKGNLSERIDPVNRYDRDRSKENIKNRIFAPPLNRPSSRNNLDKKYLPPQPRIY